MIPPRDVDGKVLPHDSQDIPDVSGLIRYVPYNQVVADPKAPTGERLSNGAFSPSSIPNHGMSADLEVLMDKADLDPLAQCPTDRGRGSKVAARQKHLAWSSPHLRDGDR